MHGKETRAKSHSGLGQLSTLLTMSSEPVVLLDASARISGWNAAAEILLGWSSAELLGQPLVPTVLPDDDARFSRSWADLGSSSQPRTLLAVARTREGAEVGVVLRLAGISHVAQLAGAVLMIQAAPAPAGGGPPREQPDHDDLFERLTALVPTVNVPDSVIDLNNLRRGITDGELRLHFQPIIELATSALWGVEALVRWEHPRHGLVPPSGFIELAERSGDIVALGSWVTRQACLVAAELAPTRVSINLSARQLADPEVLDMLISAIRASGCEPGRIEIEVTETALMLDLEAARDTLIAMKALGVGLALDDFGTGYSSLVYLKQFPVDRLKIDRSFVAGLGENPDDTAIVTSTISLGHSIGIRCVAEGVETPEQLRLLHQLHCDYAQGYGIARPMPLEQLREWKPPALPEARPGATPRRVAERLPHAPRILQMHAEGASLTTIAAALNADGLRTQRGVRWSASSVARVIAKSH